MQLQIRNYTITLRTATNWVRLTKREYKVYDKALVFKVVRYNHTAHLFLLYLPLGPMSKHYYIDKLELEKYFRPTPAQRDYEIFVQVLGIVIFLFAFGVALWKSLYWLMEAR